MINFANAFQDELAPTVFQFMLDNARFKDGAFNLPSVREIMLNFRIDYSRAKRMIENLINNDIISKLDDEHVYSNYVLVNKYLIQMVEEMNDFCNLSMKQSESQENVILEHLEEALSVNKDTEYVTKLDDLYNETTEENLEKLIENPSVFQVLKALANT